MEGPEATSRRSAELRIIARFRAEVAQPSLRAFDDWSPLCDDLRSDPNLLAQVRRSVAEWELVDGALAFESDPTRAAEESRLDGEVASASAAGLAVGDRVGRFVLREFLAQGGMGQVWSAEDTELRRHVALKLVLPTRIDERSLGLFVREARAGGRLRHPNIVTTLDFGTSDGRAWIAQELVEGSRTLKDFIEATRAAESTSKDYYREVAHLVAQIGDALHAAHQAGVIHRDVKPANVLLTSDGTPKLTDFGLARVVDDSRHSVSGNVVGTWSYMSPEQVTASRSGIDHRTDVFSLGVVLYELLTLRRPFDGDTTHQIAQQVLHHDPPDPTRVRSQCPPDLAVICAKAMEKERGMRYSTAAELAADLVRFSRNEPILARAPRATTRAWKWMRRNPTLAAGGVIGLVALAIISVLLILITADARALSKLAEEERQARVRAQDTHELLIASFEAGDFDEGGRHDMTVAEAMVRALARVESGDLGSDPVSRWRLRVAIADVLRSTTELERAREVLERCLVEAQSSGEIGAADLSDCHMVTGNVAAELGSFEEAQFHYVQCLEIRRKSLGSGHLLVADVLDNLGLLELEQSRPEAARRYFTEGRDIRLSRVGHDSYENALSTSRLAALESDFGDHERALELYRECLAIQVSLTRPDEVLLANTYHNIGSVLCDLGRLEEAVDCLQSALPLLERGWGPESWDVANCVNSLGSAYFELERYEEALGSFQRAHANMLALRGTECIEVAMVQTNIGNVLRELDRYSEAVDAHDAAVDTCKRLGDRSAVAAGALRLRAVTFRQGGRTSKALADLQAARAIFEELGDGSELELADCDFQAALIHQELEHYERAVELYRAAFAVRSQFLTPPDEVLADTHEKLAVALDDCGEFALSCEHYEKCLSMREALGLARDESSARVWCALGFARVETGRVDEAFTAFDRAISVYGGDEGVLSEDLAFAHGAKAVAAMVTKRFDIAQFHAAASVDVLRQLPDAEVWLVEALMTRATVDDAAGDLESARAAAAEGLEVGAACLAPDDSMLEDLRLALAQIESKISESKDSR